MIQEIRVFWIARKSEGIREHQGESGRIREKPGESERIREKPGESRRIRRNQRVEFTFSIKYQRGIDKYFHMPIDTP